MSSISFFLARTLALPHHGAQFKLFLGKSIFSGTHMLMAINNQLN